MALGVNQLTPQTAAGRSSSFVVASGVPLTVALYTNTGAALASNPAAQIQRSVNANWYSMNFPDGTAAVLTTGRSEATITAPGTYSVLKGVTTDQVGVMTDS